MRILNETQGNLLDDLKQTLQALRQALTDFGMQEKDADALLQSMRQLDDLFLLVVVGEFNSGKSSFINALVGEKILKEGVTPTTTEVSIIRYSEAKSDMLLEKEIHLLTFPSDLLREISIVDTPGTNAVIREHERITTRFMPRADMVLFITSADRPFTESERNFLEKVRDWGKKLVVIINKIDIFENEDELNEVIAFVRDNSTSLLGLTPEIFPVSARHALRAKQGEPQWWSGSRFEAVEAHIHDTLDETERIKLKFLNPIGIASHLSASYREYASERLQILSEDVRMLDDVERQLNAYAEDLRRDFAFRLSDMEKMLLEMEERGDAFFDDTMRLINIADLMKKDRVQHQFEQRVIADLPKALEQKINELIDWLVDSDFQQWQAVMNHLAARRSEHQTRIVGGASAAQFHYDRERLMEDLGRKATRVVENYDHPRQARIIASNAQDAVAATAALEIGAVGVGTLIAVLGTAAAVDATGIILGSSLAILGLFVIPAKKKQAKKEMRAKTANMRETLISSLEKQFEIELRHSLDHIREAVDPYQRFVRAESTRLSDMREMLERLETHLSELRSQVNGLG